VALAAVVALAAASVPPLTSADGTRLAKASFPDVRSGALGREGELVLPWNGRNPEDLHGEYGNIFKFGNRNAASHLWSTFLLDRAVFLTEAEFLNVASGYCAVSGSPVGPRPSTRYKMRLQKVDGSGRETGFMYYCCWPCVCDTQDFIRADTKTIRTKDGGARSYPVAVIGNPCDHPAKLAEPFTQPFDKRETTILQDAREVRCGPSGELIGATMSDHGFVIISLFFNATGEKEHQDETMFADHCQDRADNGYNSGMGEIFRRVAAISPVKIHSGRALPPHPDAAAKSIHTYDDTAPVAGAGAGGGPGPSGGEGQQGGRDEL